ncbi:hypothetical protein C900_04638 [Fulvivirga imtechensis AK7]|uniref:Anti-sigma factor n=1 Tax=Fulvivirga imtechensis AK7 TaxID=1237149 RepID=L8JLJ4_9BACT|nr:hypothetical protein [Fulvivirga imtechensis]ELR69791.1 hypothetical protein C900_04638 [Fulvivirga imtechensis AK7]
MNDRLKEEVEKRRSAFDLHEPDLDQLWQGIEEGVRQKERHSLWRSVMKIAASLLLLCSLGIVIWSYNKGYEKEGYALHDISPELAETEYYYSQLVDEKLRVIRASNADVDEEVMKNLQTLDSAYQDLKKDLKDNVDSEEVISAMISNYRIKLNILEQILTEIKHHDQKEQQQEVNI